MDTRPIAVRTQKGYAIMHESGLYFLNEDEDLSDALTIINHQRQPKLEGPKDRLAKAIIYLSSDCNLRCIYCYASSGEKHTVVNVEQAKILIDFIAQKCDRLILDFHGGGEPLLHFDIIKELYEYAHNTHKLYRTVLISNGVIQHDKSKILNWIITHIDVMAISCDGDSFAQNMNRPIYGGGDSSSEVEDTIKYLAAHDYAFTVRSTITGATVNHMLEITKYFDSLGARYLIYAPCYNWGRSREKSLVPDTKAYGDNFIKSIEYAYKHNMRITTNSFRYPGYHYCGALSGFNIALTTDGYISACYEVTRNDDDAGKVFIVGKIENDHVKLFPDKITNMLKMEDLGPTRCSTCAYRLVCRGGCPVKKVRNSKDSLYNLCGITRYLVPKLLDFLHEHPEASSSVLKDVDVAIH